MEKLASLTYLAVIITFHHKFEKDGMNVRGEESVRVHEDAYL